jgi:hypothetical protein
VFLISYLYSFFMEAKIAYAPQSECKPQFIFTPQDVQYCSEIYPIDVVLIALKANPFSHVCLISSFYFLGKLFRGIK